MIHCLKTWGHYIGSEDVVVWTDNFTLKYFTTQPKLSSKQVRQQNTLAFFNVDIQHQPKKDNVVTDVLNRKHQLKVVYMGEIELQKEVWLLNCCDEFANEIKQTIQKEIKSHFRLRGGLLSCKQNQLYVPKGKLKYVLLKECHDVSLVGHGGVKLIITFLKKTYYWPNLKDNVKE